MFGTGSMRTIVLPAMAALKPSQKIGLQASRKRAKPNEREWGNYSTVHAPWNWEMNEWQKLGSA